MDTSRLAVSNSSHDRAWLNRWVWAGGKCAVALLFLGNSMGGCMSDGGHYDHHDPRPSGNYPVDNPPLDSRPVEGPSIPRDAGIVDEGRRHLVCFAGDSGNAYVYDADDRALILTTSLRRGDKLVFGPEDGKGFINDKTIFDERIPRDHTYRIYFDGRSARSDKGDWDRERDRDRDRDRRSPVIVARPPAPAISSGGMKIPNSATSVARGQGRLRFEVPRNGEVYVQDIDNGRVVLGSTMVHAGDRFVVDPDRQKASLEGRNELQVPLNRSHAHELFYVPYSR